MAVLVTSKSWDPTASSACSDSYLLGDSPGTLAKDLIEIHGHGVGSYKTLNLCLLSRGQDPHDGLGCKLVLGSLLVVTLWHITKHDMSSLVDIVDNLAKVALEILGGKTLKVSKSCWRNVSLPLQVSFSSINKGSKGSIFSHELSEGSGNLQFSCRDRTDSPGRSKEQMTWLQQPILGMLPLDRLAESKSRLIEAQARGRGTTCSPPGVIITHNQRICLRQLTTSSILVAKCRVQENQNHLQTIFGANKKTSNICFCYKKHITCICDIHLLNKYFVKEKK